MKSPASTLRLVAPLVMVFCFICVGSQPLQAQQTFSFPDFSSHANLRANGNASFVVVPVNDTNTTVLRLTPNSIGQFGTAWYASSLSLKSGFSTTFTFRLSSPSQDSFGPADGIAFVIQNGSFPNETSGNRAADSSAGGGGIGFQGLTHSVAIEFDTFCNPEVSDTCASNVISSDNEVGILSCGAAANSVSHSLCGLNQVGLNNPILADGGVHTAVITYTPPGRCNFDVCTGQLTVMLDQTQVLSTSFDLASLGLDQDQDAFVGFTAATGAGDDNQDILSWSLNASQQGSTIDPGVPGSLIQTFHFGGAEGSDQVDDYTFNYSIASQADTLTVQPGTTPFITNLQVSPADWPAFVNGTPFATTSCIPTNGANGNCTAKRQVCSLSPGDTPTGDKCPQSTVRNILLSADLDAPSFLPGTIFGATEAVDDWPGGACIFPAGEAESGKSCPQNTLVSFTGPGQYTGRRGASSTNSTAFLYSGLIQPSTTVFGFVNQSGWTNNASPAGTFTGNPPQLPSPNSNNMTDPPVTSITYGVDNLPADTPTLHPTDLPISGDTVIPNPAVCPATLTAQQQQSFGPNPVTLGPFADGSTHQLHYFTTDCATTEELKFIKDAASNWSTSFNTLSISVDLTKPVISAGPTLSPAPTTNNGVPNSYLINQAVTANYTCSDPLPASGLASGLATCNSSSVAGAPLTAPFTNRPVVTSAGGSFNYTVAGPTDVAGNIGASKSTPYTVVDQPVDIDLFYLAPAKVKPGSTLTYFIAAVNFAQKNVASGVVLTDMAPAGTTVLSAFFDKVSCLGGLCSLPKKGTACTIGAPTASGTPISCNIGSLAPLNTFTGAGLVIVVQVPPNMALNKVLTDTATAQSLNRINDQDNSISISTIVKNN
jgi:uncharacterized repeat protein (TIGR01451 family)